MHKFIEEKCGNLQNIDKKVYDKYKKWYKIMPPKSLNY